MHGCCLKFWDTLDTPLYYNVISANIIKIPIFKNNIVKAKRTQVTISTSTQLYKLAFESV